MTRIMSRSHAIAQQHLLASAHETVAASTEANGSIGGDLQAITMTFITCFVPPLLYQAFLQIGLALSQPIGSELGAIPSRKMIENLKRDLEHANLLADAPP